ncbi:glycosyltransferase [Mycoplasmatota bacterium]|nr:glycosyltransferase [Mycoplasmatota bacterium]
MSKGTILYVGGFRLPDGNAAAHRVINNAKIMRDLGYNVVFINKLPSDQNKEKCFKNYFGFECIELHNIQNKKTLLKGLYDISDVISSLNHFDDVNMIIAYNYPAIALYRIKDYCKKNGIKCIADVSEWYGTKKRSILYKVIKGTDSTLRMRFVHKKMDGLIVISSFLENYYKGFTNTVCIPPLTDVLDIKWKIKYNKKEGVTTFIYAGTPSGEKERLDIIVKSVLSMKKNYPVKLNVFGITLEQFLSIYKLDIKNFEKEFFDTVNFLGRVDHNLVIKYVKEADYSFLIRDNNRVTKAGFPTKFVESITCGTPVIANSNSDIEKYISNDINGYLVTLNDLNSELQNILNSNNQMKVETNRFDYRNYITEANSFLDKLLINK